MPVAPQRTAGWVKVDTVYIYVSSMKPPSSADWDAYIAWLKETAKPVAGRQELLSVIYDRSTGPNAAQRKQLTDVIAGWKLRVAVLTPSPMVRGIVTALNWFKKDMYQAFSPDDLDNAFAYLGAHGRLAPEARRHIRQLVTDLDAP